MAELTNSTENADNSSCCALEAQANCCEPSAKAECCDPGHADGCGCAAGEAAPRSGAVGARYAAAGRVTITDPGADRCAPGETFDGGSPVCGAALQQSEVVR